MGIFDYVKKKASAAKKQAPAKTADRRSKKHAVAANSGNYAQQQATLSPTAVTSQTTSAHASPGPAPQRGPRRADNKPDVKLPAVMQTVYDHASSILPDRDLASERKSQLDGAIPENLEELELIAHGLAYDGPDGKAEQLAESGYTPLSAVHPYAAGLLGSGAKGLHMEIVKSDSDKAPVLAFRGTEPTDKQDLATDIDIQAVGHTQFEANKDRIEAILRALSHDGETPVVLTGHSLGGALCQQVAAEYPEYVADVVTFQSPGVDQATVDKLGDYNSSVDPDRQIESTHVVASGDLVSSAGEAHTEGTVLEFDPDALTTLGAHKSTLYSNGKPNPVEVSSTDKLNKDGVSKTEWLRKGAGFYRFARSLLKKY